MTLEHRDELSCDGPNPSGAVGGGSQDQLAVGAPGTEVHQAFVSWSPPYGERILTVSNDETARLWPPAALDKLADELITRDFTAEERTEYLN